MTTQAPRTSDSRDPGETVARATDEGEAVVRRRATGGAPWRHLARPVATLRARAAGRSGGQLARFATIGVASTVLHLGLFALLHARLGEQLANGAALVVATVLNTAANRAWTFGVRGREGLGRHHAQSLAVFALTWALTSAALTLLGAAWPSAPTLVLVAAVASANVVSTAVRFVAMRRWIFRPALG